MWNIVVLIFLYLINHLSYILFNSVLHFLAEAITALTQIKEVARDHVWNYCIFFDVATV